MNLPQPITARTELVNKSIAKTIGWQTGLALLFTDKTFCIIRAVESDYEDTFSVYLSNEINLNLLKDWELITLEQYTIAANERFITKSKADRFHAIRILRDARKKLGTEIQCTEENVIKIYNLACKHFDRQDILVHWVNDGYEIVILNKDTETKFYAEELL